MPDDFGFTHADPAIDDATLIANGYRPVPEYPATDGKPAKPVYAGWNCWLPSVEFLARMRQRHRGAVNTGILTGELVATDRDDEDPGRAAAILEVIEMELGASPVHRVASKGGAEFYRTAEPFPSIEVVGRARGETQIRTLFEIHGVAKKTKDGKPLHKKLTAFGLNKHGQPIRYVKAGPDGTIATLMNTPLIALPLVTREQAMRCAEVVRQSYEVFGFTDVEIKGTRNWSRDDLGQFRQGHGEAVPFEYLQRMCAALNPDNLARAERVDFVTGIRAVNCPDDPDGNSRAELMVKWRRGDLRNEKAASFHDSDKDGDEDGVAAHIRDTFYGREPEGAIGFGTAHHLARTKGTWTEPAPHPHGDPNESFDESLKREQREPSDEYKTAQAMEWGDPTDPFNEEALQTPTFDIELLPAVLRDFAVDQAMILSTDPVGFFVPLMATIAAVAAKDFEISLRRDNAWCERLNEYTATLAHSGSYKSEIYDRCFKALEELERRNDKLMGPRQTEYFRATREWQRLKEMYDLNYKEAFGDVNVKHETAIGIVWKEDPLWRLTDKPHEPKPTRLLSGDTSNERTKAMIGENDGVPLTQYPGELATLLSGFGRHRNASNKDFDEKEMLDMYGGKVIRVDRAGAGSLHVDGYSFGIAGSIQDDTLDQYRLRFTGDGFFPRFMWGVLGDRGKPNHLYTANMDAVWNWCGLIRKIHDLPRAAGRCLITLSPEARDIWEEFQNDMADQINSAALKSPGLSSHLVRAQTHFGKNMGRLTLADAALTGAPLIVSGKTAENLLAITENYLLPSSERVFAAADTITDEWKLAAAIRSLILTRERRLHPPGPIEKMELPIIRPRDVYRMDHSKIHQHREIRDAMTILENLDIVAVHSKRPGENPTSYVVNLRYHNRFEDLAHAEVKRKDALKERLNSAEKKT